MQPIVVTVGPLASASATKIGASQIAAGAQYLVMDGAAGVADADSICQTQNPGGAGALTMNGVYVASDGVAYIPYPQRVYITSAGNDSSFTFTIVGTSYSPTTGVYGITEVVTGANTSVASSLNLFSTVSSITVSGNAGSLTVGTYGTATLDVARRVIVTSGGNDTGITFTVIGTDRNGVLQTEVLTGASGAAAQTALDFKTVTSIKTSGAVATTVTVGTNGVASSQWVRFDDYAASSPVAIQCTPDTTGGNYTVQQTMDDPNRQGTVLTPYTVTWVNHPDSNLVGATTTIQGNYAYAPVFARVLLNSGSGTVTGTFRQAYTW